MPVTLTETDALADPNEGIWSVVLGRTPRGERETQSPLFPLSEAQRTLLRALDGRRSLRQLVAAQPTMHTARLARDAARLFAFGLVKQLRGELPRDIVVASMNLTMRVPVEAFRHLAPTQARHAAAQADHAGVISPQVAGQMRWPWVAIALAAVALMLIAGWPAL